MVKKAAAKEPVQKYWNPSCDEKWMKHREAQQRHTDEKAGKEIADMDRLDFHCFSRKQSIADRRD